MPKISKEELQKEISKWAKMYSDEDLLLHAKATSEIVKVSKKIGLTFQELKKAVDKFSAKELNAKNEEAKAAKEKLKLLKEAEKLGEEEQKKILLNELEKKWEICDDSLFIAAFEADAKKAIHYFSKRLFKEKSYYAFEDNRELIVYQKDEGIYIQNAEIAVAQEVEKRIEEKATIHQVLEIVEKIKRMRMVSRGILNEQPLHLKPVGNGLLNIKTMKLEPFSDEYIFLTKTPANFIPGEDCPKFKKFLKEVTSDKEKNPIEKNVQIVKQWMGYSLLNDCRFEKAMLLYGRGGNGKSVLLKVIRKFLGERNVTSIALQYLETNNFALSRFFGKSANIFTDLPKKALEQTSKFKMVVSGDPATAEKKGKESFEFIPVTKQMFSCNEVPRTPDMADAFFDRWIILKFLHDFRSSTERIEKLEDTFLEEMPGILNFAVEGLKEILAEGFVKHMTRAEIMDFWLRHSDSIASFNLDMVEKNLGGEELKEDVFNTYKSYCLIKGYSADEQNAFWRHFQEVCEYQEYHPGVKEPDRRRRVKGITLKALPTARGEEND